MSRVPGKQRCAMPDPPLGPESAEPPGPADETGFEGLLEFLKENRGFDFTGYKRPSLMRRVRHRMQEVGVARFDDYQDVLTLHPDEFTALFNTILINVTSFFRDADAWEALAELHLPQLLRAAGTRPVRVWSAGCAAGQEAYSIAMLLQEQMGADFRERAKIYATDVDEDALQYARQASYTEREVRGVPDERRQRHFDRVSDRFVVKPELRRAVIFGRNDLVRDAPISRIDVLLCRNTLMYFNVEAQSRVVNRLGFALRGDGILFLGKAEMLLNHAAVFEPLDLGRRFFRRVRAEEDGGYAAQRRPRGAWTRQLPAAAALLRDEAFMTSPVAQLVIGAGGELALVNHRAAALAGLTDRDLGRPFQDLELSFRPVELRSHLAAVEEARRATLLRDIAWSRTPDEPRYLDVEIAPLLDHEGSVYLGACVSFTDVTRARQLRMEVEATNRQLELAYEELQSTNEELETTNEELQSTVEELETTNEELQSTNEELETMNEELQSANDELQVTNMQLQERDGEVSDLNAFMQSILASLESAIVVVDRDLVVRAWTPQAHELWGLREDETLGRHVLNLDSGLPVAELHPWLRAVIRGDREAVIGRHMAVVNRRGRSVTLRVTLTPMHDRDGTVGGVLLVMEEVATGSDPAPVAGSE